MRIRTLYCYFSAVLALTLALHASSPAAVQNRITGAVQENNRVSLSHTVAPRAMHAADLGTAPANLKLEDLAVRFSMTDAQQAALSQLLIDLQNPASPRFHKWLTPQQFGAQFGLSAGDLAKVSSWLTSQGFTITSTAKSSTFITFSGTAAQVQQAFGTTIHSVSLDGEQHLANLTEPTLPAAIAGVVQEISGLNDLRIKPRVRKTQHAINPLKPQFTTTVCANTSCTSSQIANFMAPGDFYTIYDIPNPQAGSNLNGSGITIAVMGQVDLNSDALNDVAAFRAASGLSANIPTTQLYGADPSSPTASSCIGNNPPSSCDDVSESLLDVEWAGAVAPSAKIIFVTSNAVISTSLLQAIDNNLAPIMTVSYGSCEASVPSASITSLNLAFQQANAEGITLLGPAGDDGATDCDSNDTSAKQGLAVDFPASSPFVTGVGGTMFNEGSGTYWNTNGNFSGSATSYIPETVWNETAGDLASTSPAFGATGGGASILFPKPSWQTGTGVPNDSHRDVPDVSLNAAANHDGYLVCAFGSCSGGTYFGASGNFNVFGGTSASTPSFAGILALVEQKLGGVRMGNVNPYIYMLAKSASYANIFHDVQSGNNNSPCTSGSINCPSGTTSIGFTAGPGYDLATGWGSVDANQLANGFTSIIAGTIPTGTISLSASPASVTISSGGNISSVITVTSASGYAGTVNFAASASTLNGSPAFTPVSVTIAAGGTGKTTFTATSVSAALKSSGNLRSSGGISSLILGGGATLAGLLFFGLTGTRRKGWPTLFSLLAIAVLFAGAGCSSSSTSTGSTGKGTFTVTLTGTDSVTNAITANTTLTVTIQ